MLKGTNLDGSKYESTVQYWMPFVGNVIGMHDADWQPYFGGTRYQDGGGSHGCVTRRLRRLRLCTASFSRVTWWLATGRLYHGQIRYAKRHHARQFGKRHFHLASDAPSGKGDALEQLGCFVDGRDELLFHAHGRASLRARSR